METIDVILIKRLIESLGLDCAGFVKFCHNNQINILNVTVFDDIYEKVCIYKRDVVFKLNGEFLTILENDENKRKVSLNRAMK